MKKDFRYDAALLSRASFPAVLEADDRPCIVEITVYRLNAVAVTSLMLDGFDPLLNFIGLSPDDTYITQHEIEDIVTVAHIRKGAEVWQHSMKYMCVDRLSQILRVNGKDYMSAINNLL